MHAHDEPAESFDRRGQAGWDEALGDDLAAALDDAALDDAALLDEAFPLGDGTADDGALVYCPYCGEPNEITLDPGSGARQEYVEDCHVCCQPWQVIVWYRTDGSADVSVLTTDDA
jgi:hypothetical protein